MLHINIICLNVVFILDVGAVNILFYYRLILYIKNVRYRYEKEIIVVGYPLCCSRLDRSRHKFESANLAKEKFICFPVNNIIAILAISQYTYFLFRTETRS